MNAQLQFRPGAEEMGLLKSVLNEVLHGFEIREFERRIGLERKTLDALFEQFRLVDRRETATLDINQTRAFRNALFETIRELGVHEFETRTGYSLHQGEAVLEKLDHLLSD